MNKFNDLYNLLKEAIQISDKFDKWFFNKDCKIVYNDDNNQHIMQRLKERGDNINAKQFNQVVYDGILKYFNDSNYSSYRRATNSFAVKSKSLNVQVLIEIEYFDKVNINKGQTKWVVTLRTILTDKQFKQEHDIEILVENINNIEYKVIYVD